MMHLQRHFGYAEGDGWQAVELPYVFGELAMTVVVGDADLADAIGELTDNEVILSFPKFDIETSTSLADVLGALGMATAFTDGADFTGMTTDEPLHISDVVHQANITVDEEGTEAAAATAVVMTAGAAPAPGEPVTMVVDRPFTFALRDVPTGAIVFLGRVGDPSQGRV
jgi:serpin B